jgi:hypothetical protein
MFGWQFVWVDDDESGPADARMMWILSADDGNNESFQACLEGGVAA